MQYILYILYITYCPYSAYCTYCSYCTYCTCRTVPYHTIPYHTFLTCRHAWSASREENPAAMPVVMTWSQDVSLAGPYAQQHNPKLMGNQYMAPPPQTKQTNTNNTRFIYNCYLPQLVMGRCSVGTIFSRKRHLYLPYCVYIYFNPSLSLSLSLSLYIYIYISR